MDIHDNARTTRHSRMLMVRRLAGRLDRRSRRRGARCHAKDRAQVARPSRLGRRGGTD